jgi:hypothetical protein
LAVAFLAAVGFLAAGAALFAAPVAFAGLFVVFSVVPAAFLAGLFATLAAFFGAPGRGVASGGVTRAS